MDKKVCRLYEFDRFRLDASECVLLYDMQEVPLAPKVFETLLLLVEKSGHIVGKEELLQTIWPDSIVEESSLSQNISLLRKALGDGSGGRQFIETIPKRGYKFVAPVKRVDNSVTAGDGLPYNSVTAEVALKEESDSQTHRREEVLLQSDLASTSSASHINLSLSRKHAVIGIILMLALAGGMYLWVAIGRDEANAESGNRVRSLATLPFKPIGGESGDEFIGLGMANALIHKFSSFDGLKILTTGSIVRYTGSGHDAREVGKRLGVDAVLDGTVQRAGDRVRVTAILFDLRNDKILWSGKFDERFSDVFTLQDSISERVSGALKLGLAAGGRWHPPKRFTESVDAYQSYSMGLYLCNKGTPEGLSKAVEYFRQATEKDPNYALAFALLAGAYTEIAINGYDFIARDEAREKARAAAAKAIELDGALPEAIAAVGLVKEEFDGDLEGAEQMYRRAIDLNPGFGIVYMIYAGLLIKEDKLEEAIKYMQRALEFDPLSPITNSYMSMLHRIMGRPGEALKYSRIALEISPNHWYARVNLGEAYEANGMYQDAAAEYKKIAAMEGLDVYGKHKLIYLYMVMGRLDEARKLFVEAQKSLRGRKAKPQETLSATLAHIALGMNDKAFDWLNKAVESGALSYYTLQRNTKLDPLRSDPRFESLRHRLKPRRRT
jgi:DNA-binding winged helix-turn-helix (wHTH) protein/TolB-like protein/tetratricopeptide (TPR) repeat protein